MINKIKKFIKDNNLDGYIVPKNDNYFTEYSKINNLYKVSNFTGSAGFALVLKNINYLFVDGRYTLQAKIQSGNRFNIVEIPKIWPKDIFNIKGLRIGFNPKLFTELILEKYFKKEVLLVPKEYDFKNNSKENFNKFYQLNSSICGKGSKEKIKLIKNHLIKNKIDFLYVSASENVNWLLNIRGKDLPNSPLANCKLIINKNRLYLFSNLNKASKIKKNINNITLCEEESFFKIINALKGKNFGIDENTCSIFDQGIIKSKFNITSKIDPTYFLKSIKNPKEIDNTRKAHIEDGVALTKFLYWFKSNKKNITEKKIEEKLEKFRKKSNNYLFPSFDTIAGSGPNGAIIHYKSNYLTNRKLKKNDILLIDSGGQYKWGTTDVTRTTCTGKISNKIKDNFTRVLKGHIAVVLCDLKKNFNGHLIDRLARKNLKKVGLNYAHGTGHGVGYFLNVHEGPHAISKRNKINFQKGMIVSNEPGYYEKNKFGIRIENLIYVKENKRGIAFENLTMAPIEKDLIIQEKLNKNEKNWLNNYHRTVFKNLIKSMNKTEALELEKACSAI